MAFRFSPKRLTASMQYELLRAARLEGGTGKIRLGKLVWEFLAQPSPIGREYRVKITYANRTSPKVYVCSPDLHELAEGRKIPHLYSLQPPRLCLYFPHSGEWDSSMPIADSIVRWTFLWLYFFEDWLATDVWKGGGRHPIRTSRGRCRNSNDDIYSESIWHSKF